MKPILAKRHAARLDTASLERVLPQIQSLIEASRQHVVSTANLTLVWLYWNVGRIITEEIQRHPGRADYGEQLLQRLATSLTEQYGRGYSISNLWDMRRFFEAFDIPQPAAVDSQTQEIPQPLAVVSSSRPIRSPTSSKSEHRLTINFSKHAHLGWTHYRILLSVEAGLKRGFYFEQAASQRWSKRELQSQIERALFERVALSRDTGALVRLEKQRGPVETVRYEDAFLEEKHEWREEAENEPVGLILCTSKKRQHVELLLSSGPHKMQVSEYLTQLPPKHALAERLKIYSRLLEQEETKP